MQRISPLVIPQQTLGLSLIGIGNTAPATTLSVLGNVNIGFTGYTSEPLGLSVRGNVGIGVTTPNSNLVVLGNATIGATSLGATSPTNGLLVQGNVGIGSTGLGSSGNGSFNFDVWGTGRFSSTLTVDGNLGIGGTASVNKQPLVLNGYNCSGLSNGGNVICADDAGGGGVSPDTLDFTDFSDTMTLDASTSIAFGAGALGLTFTNDGSANMLINLTSTGVFLIQDNGTEAFQVTDSGEVRIGMGNSSAFPLFADRTAVPSLNTNGQFALGSLSGTTTNGRIWVRSNGRTYRFNSAGNAADFSEYIAQSEPSEPGDVMVIDVDNPEKVRKSRAAYEPNILGVISTTGTGYNNDDCPADATEEDRLLGNCDRANSPNWANVGMLGQIDVKVSTENGPIKVGDRLTTSNTPGVAMKATKPGQIVGRALAAYEESDPTKIGKIKILVSPSYFDPAEAIDGEEDIASLTIEAQNTTPYTAQVPFAKDGQAESASNFGKYSIQGLTSGVVKGVEGIIANLKTGAILSEEVVSDSLIANQAALSNLDVSYATIDEAVIKTLKVGDTGKIEIQLADNGQLEVTGINGSQIVSIVNNGDAYFAGTLTAKAIKADSIEGLKVITDELVAANLTVKLDSLAAQIASSSNQTIDLNTLIVQASQSAELVQKVTIEDENIKILGNLTIDQSAMVSLDLEVLGKLTVGELHVKEATIFDGIVQVLESLTVRTLIVTDWTHFLAEVLFKGDVEFEGRPIFNKDTAGFALINKDASEVEVIFETEYAQTPLVNISITLDEMVSDQDRALLSPEDLLAKEASQAALEEKILAGDIRYIVTRRTTRGFVIKLNVPAPEDLKFTWSALAVKDAKTSISQSNNSPDVLATEVSPSATPTLTPTPSSTPIPTPSPSPPPPKTITINDNELGYLRVRSGPGTSFEEIGQVNIGETFEVFEEYEDWYQIEYLPSQYGWVSASYVSVL
ncbi:SH3 domain-containing protein [Candidatus Daviesbacteria bacterium]|nr:SH3 domain-containing protein [Candidatus Daviesbacteria bacterium]